MSNIYFLDDAEDGQEVFSESFYTLSRGIKKEPHLS